MSFYKDLQIQVYEWLKSKHQKDSSFNFSVRQKANKGAELNYFIGTEKSKYFSTTFWFVPVSYPGSSGDLINLVFDLRSKKSLIEFSIQFNQTRDPDDAQNRYALEFIQSLKMQIKDNFENVIIVPETNKMEFFAAYSTRKYSNFDEMKSDLDAMLNKVIPIVNRGIEDYKIKHPDFTAHPFSLEDQEKMFGKMQERFKKYKIIEDLEEELEEEEELIIIDPHSEFNYPLNQILYGPPGTGKTYRTINRAIAIANPNFNLNQEREKIKDEYNRLVNVGQIVFCTFHQSMSYEDFVEGIKPQIEEDSDGNKSVIYEVKKGVFKLIVEKAKSNRSKEETVNFNYDFDDGWDALIKEANSGLVNNDPIKLSIQTPNLGLKIVDVTEKGNLKLKPIYSEEAKEYIVSYSRTKTLQEVFPDLSVIKNIDKEFRAVIGGSNSTAYWAVINYINNKINSEKKPTTQQIILPALSHVLIIDEINRGNVSQIFGELITLIEDSKRLGKDESLEVTLPYSKETFGVPSNLYIIGTMNTADRSVESLDTALRRRFSFEEMMPDLDILTGKNIQGIILRDLLYTINKRVEILLDRDHMIGHSYFINIKSEDDLKNTFKNNIIPLLQEYFYGDYEKIGMILGQEFFEEPEKYTKDIFACFKTPNFPDSGNILRLKVIDRDFNIIKALETLLKKEYVINE